MKFSIWQRLAGYCILKKGPQISTGLSGLPSIKIDVAMRRPPFRFFAAGKRCFHKAPGILMPR
jgi:hypothetical protein